MTNKKQAKLDTDSAWKEGRPPNILLGAETNDLVEVLAAIKRDPECVNLKDEETGMTALHWSGANRNLELAHILLSDDAEVQVNVWAKDKWDRYAIDLAMETGNQTLIDFLQKKMFWEDYEYDFDPHDPPEGISVVISKKFEDE